MKHQLSIALIFAAILPAATVTRVACGSPFDTGFVGGAPWTGAAIAGQAAPYNAMRSSSPIGAPFSYSFTLAPGAYTVTLQFIEPRPDQAAGNRLLNVALNGAPVATGLDLFAVAGAVKPYSVSYPVTVSGSLRIDVSASKGNAILSGIQIDDVPAVSPANALDRPVCEYLWGGGWGLSSGVYSAWGCEVLDGAPLLVTRVTFRCDVPGQILDVQAMQNGAWQSILTTPVTCTQDRAEASVIPGASYMGVLLLALRVIDPTVDAPSPQQVVVSIVRAVAGGN
jgi:hypothetical protein